MRITFRTGSLMLTALAGVFVFASVTHAACPAGKKKIGTAPDGTDICFTTGGFYESDTAAVTGAVVGEAKSAVKLIYQCNTLTEADIKRDPSICLKCVSEIKLNPLWLISCSSYGGGEVKKKIKQATCDRGPHDGKEGVCCIENDKGGEQFHMKTETCYDEKNEETFHYYGDCFCVIKGIDDPSIVAGSPMSSKSCRLACEAQGGRASTNRGIGRLQAGRASQKPDETQFVNLFCFTKEECASEQYGGSERAFVPHAICPTGMGKCLAPEPTIELQSGPILGVTKVAGLRRYIDLMYRFFLSIVVLTAGIMFVYGGFKYVLSSAGADIGSAKETMVNAAIGLVLSLGAVALLRTVNPATLDLTRLDIYLLKKVQYAKFNFCREFKGDAGKTPKFADAGVAPKFKPYESAKFTLTSEQTSCGAQYFPDGLGGKTCVGDVCPTGHACLSCKGAGEIGECAGVQKGYACVKSIFAGNVSWQDNREPKNIYLLPVCNFIQPPKNFDAIDSNVLDNYKGKLSLKSGEKGEGSYLFSFDQKQFDSWKSECKGKGGLRGFLIGVVYQDPYDVTAAVLDVKKRREAIANFKKGAAVGVTRGVIGALYGGAIGTIVGNLNDVAIITPSSCGKKGFYPGYADGGTRDLKDIKEAIYCGWSMKPGDTFADISKYKSEGSTQVFNKLSDGDPNDPYWNVKQVEQAVKEGKPITCNILFDNEITPSNPSSAYLGCCSAKSTWENADATKLWCK